MVQNNTASIGVLVDISATHFVARITPGRDALLSTSGAGRSDERGGLVGSYILVRQPSYNVLTVIEKVWQEQVSGAQPVTKMRLIPLGEVSESGDFQRGVRHFPGIGTEITPANDSALMRTFSRYSDGGFKVGQLSGMNEVDVFIDASNFFGRHAAILGQTGAGKSWTVTSMIQSTLRQFPQAHIIMLDLQGEYGYKKEDIKSRHPFPKDKMRSIPIEDLEVPYWLLSYAELIELLIDPGDPDAAVQTAFLRSSVIKLKNEANKDLDIGRITVDSPVYFSMDELYELFRTANVETGDFGKTKAPMHGKFDQLLVRLQSFFNDSRYNFMLRPTKRVNSKSLSALMADMVGLGNPQANITVLDLSSVPIDVRPFVTAQIGRLAFEFNFWNPHCHEFPIFLICEEAHEYIPRSDNPQFRRSRRSMERVAKQGRKYGVGLCVVSQRPHELSETVLAQCGTFVCLRMANPDDQEYVRQLVPDSSRGTFSALTALGRGEAIVLGDSVPMPVRVQVTMPDPPPNSHDVDYAGRWRRGSPNLSVEKLVELWRTQKR
jgi:DNA helicase HerA-like ATPase